MKSLLGIKLKRTLLIALAKKDFLPENPTKREELLKKYNKHIIPLEEAEWYGLTLTEALKKLAKENEPPVVDKTPLKIKFREEYLQQLKETKSEEITPSTRQSSWTSNLNPFNKFNKTV